MIDAVPTFFSALSEAGLSLVWEGQGHSSQAVPLAAWGIGAALDVLFARRAEAARRVLLEEIRAGKLPTNYVAPADELVAIMYRYQRAALEGTAELNLRLMAQVIQGQFVAANMNANEFLYYADILASLRREEIVVLGTILRLDRNLSQTQNRIKALADGLKTELVGHALFPDPETLEAYCFSVTRFGLLLEGVGDARAMWGSFPVLPSRILEKLGELINIDSALRSEPINFQDTKTPEQSTADEETSARK